VVQLRRRWIFPATALAAAAASIAAIGLGLWANSLRDQVDRQRIVAMSGAPGRLVVSGDEASLVSCLEETPAEKTYEAWVIRDRVPRPAALFRGGCSTVELTHRVEAGDTVAVTIEAAGGSNAPTGDILMNGNV
jgi:anti-sigma-K factor RskA